MKKKRASKPKLYEIKIHKMTSSDTARMTSYTIPAISLAQAMKFKTIWPEETIISVRLVGPWSSTSERWRKEA